MKNSKSFIFITLMVVFSQCGCPEDFKLGELHLQTPRFSPLHGGEKFIYINQAGEELIFDKFINNEQYAPTLIMHTLCSEGIFDSQTAYYTTENYSFDYHMNDVNGIAYHYSIKNDVVSPTSPADTALYEIFIINTPYSTVGQSVFNTTFQYIVSNRGNSISNATMQVNDNIRVIADTTLNGNQYTNLYCQKEAPGLYYSTTDGVVLFYYNEDWWYYKK